MRTSQAAEGWGQSSWWRPGGQDTRRRPRRPRLVPSSLRQKVLDLLTKKAREVSCSLFAQNSKFCRKFCAQPAKIQTSYDCADSASGRLSISNLPHQRDWSVADWYTILTVFPRLIERKKGVDVILMRLCGDRRMSKNLWLITNCNSFSLHDPNMITLIVLHGKLSLSIFPWILGTQVWWFRIFIQPKSIA